MSAFWNRSERRQRTSDNDVREILGVVHGNWDVLVVDAWAGFKSQGRGYILLDRKHESPQYVSAMSKRMPNDPNSVWSLVLRTCDVYDPETEMVVVVQNFAGRGSITPLRMSTPEGWPTPLEAYEESKAELREALASGELTLDEFISGKLPANSARRGRRRI